MDRVLIVCNQRIKRTSKRAHLEKKTAKLGGNQMLNIYYILVPRLSVSHAQSH